MHKIRAREVVKRVNHIDTPVVCEIGVFKGAMSRAMLEMKPMELYLIDPWSDKTPDSYKATGDFHSSLTKKEQDHYYRITKDAVQDFKAHIVRKFSQAAANEFPDSFFDLVFIDGDHSYEGCKADIEAYLFKVKPGGFLGGHDYANKSDKWEFGVTQAVDEFIEESGKNLELGDNYTWFVRL